MLKKFVILTQNSWGYFLKEKWGKLHCRLHKNVTLDVNTVFTHPKENMKQRTHSQKSMSWEVAKAAVDFLWNHSVDSKRVNVGFYGGEPLIEFPLIQRVVKYSKQ